MKPKIFVIVVTYKGKQWYDRCFGSLRISTCPVTTVVVDNNSADGTVEYIKKVYPEIILFESDRNLGFGQANNKGVRYALDNGCDYVFLLNQDAWVEYDTLANLIQVSGNNSDFGILSPLHLTVDKDHFENGFLNFIADYRNFDRRFMEDLYFNRLQNVYEAHYVNAAAWLLPRKTLQTVGGFDPIFFHYGEDDNYMDRVLYHGLKIGICPYSRIVHDAASPGVRKKSPAESRRRHEVLLLVKYTNLCKPTTIGRDVSYFFRKAVKNLMHFKFSKAWCYFRDIVFLIKNKKTIHNSVSVNKRLGVTWL